MYVREDMIPMYRLWLHGLYNYMAYMDYMDLDVQKRPLNLITHSLEAHRKEITNTQSLDLSERSNNLTVDLSVQRAYCAGTAPPVFSPLLLVVDYTCHSSQNPLSHVSFINSVLEARGYYLCIIIPSLTLARAGPPCTEWNYFLKVYIYIIYIYIYVVYILYI